MSAVDQAAPAGGEPTLKANSVGTGRVIAFTAAFMGPASAIATGLVASISFAGYATPLIVLLSFAGAVFATNSVAQLSRKLPSAGSFYTYNATTLGVKVGFVSGWMMVFAYVLWTPDGIGVTGQFFSEFFQSAFGWGISENILLVVVLAVVALLAYRGIATSTAVDVIVLVIEISVLVALGLTILFKGGAGPSGFHLFDPSNTPNGKFSDLTLAMVYTVVIFTGFESGAVLGEEAREPRKTVARGLLGAVAIVGVFYLFMSYSELHGVAPNQLEEFIGQGNQLSFLATNYWSSGMVWLIDLIVALSTMAFVVAAFNAAVRLIFAMGREGMLPRTFSTLSKHGTPTYAVVFVTLVGLIVGLPLTIAKGGFLAFAYIGAVVGIALILLFMSVSVAVIVGFRTIYREDWKFFQHLLMPLLAIAIFAIPLVGTFYPRPEAPYSWLPFVTIGWLVVGIVVAIYLSANHSEKLSKIGRVFVVEQPEQPYPSAIPQSTVIDESDRGI
jgi:amino acid transporter